jgi:hypothetical protein
MILRITILHVGDQIKEDVTGEACDPYGGEEMWRKDFYGESCK